MKCIKCKKVFLNEFKKPSATKTKKSLMPKTCPGCRIVGSRAPERPFKEHKK